MIGAMTITDVAQKLGVDCPDHGSRNSKIISVSTDSRDIELGGLFVALIGDRYNGHDYIDQALQKGAIAVVSQQPHKDHRVLKVANSLAAYTTLAGLNRDRYHGTTIALTGSAGKTTTRTMLASILMQKGRVHSNYANENNEIGVSRCLLQLDGNEDFAVIEMGARNAGDISWLSKIVRPDIGLIINIDSAHLETFGDIYGIAKAKGELFDALSGNARAVANGDDLLVCAQTKRAKAKTYYYSLKNVNSECFASEIALSAKWTHFRLHLRHDKVDCSAPLVMPVTGRHNIYNACASALCASLAGCDIDKIVAGLQAFEPIEGRQSTIEMDQYTTLVNDSYNANPASLKVAIDALALSEHSVRFLVLGDMLELGDETEYLHREAGDYAARQGIDMMFTYGPLAQLAARSFHRVRPDMAFSFDSHAALTKKLNETMGMHDGKNMVLIKGSRSMAMEKVIDYLRDGY